MRYFSIKNWEEFQHYKDRNPPWIKLHNKILNDYEFSCLQDASKLLLMLLWSLSSQLNNRIPEDSEWLSKRLPIKGKINLKELIDKGFLIVEHDASIPIAGCSPETEAETEVKKKKDTDEKISIRDLSLDHISDWLARKRMEGKYLQHDEKFILEYFKNYCQSNNKKYDDFVAALRNAFEWDSCQPKPIGGKYAPSGQQTKDDRAKSAVMRGVGNIIASQAES